MKNLKKKIENYKIYYKTWMSLEAAETLEPFKMLKYKIEQKVEAERK